MHTEMWEHPAVAGQPRHAAPPRRARRRARVGPPRRRRRRRRPPGRTRARSSPRSSGCSAPPDLAGLQVVVTAGGTREPIDAVRVIANRTAGKQGYADRRRGRRRGAPRSTLVIDRRPAAARRRRDRARSRPRPRCRPRVDALAPTGRRRRDGRRRGRLPARSPRPTARSRRTTAPPEIVLEPTPDILAGLGAQQAARADARRLRGRDRRPAWPTPRASCARKHLDLIVANDVSAEASGFQHDTNAVTLFAVGDRQ